jgi:hypothetical protein
MAKKISGWKTSKAGPAHGATDLGKLVPRTHKVIIFLTAPEIPDEPFAKKLA